MQAHGRPLVVGSINFFDAIRGSGASAPLGPDGAFRLAAPLRVGTYVVFWQRPIGNMILDDDARLKVWQALSPGMPQRDVNEQTSQVRVEIRTGLNELELDLK